MRRMRLLAAVALSLILILGAGMAADTGKTTGIHTTGGNETLKTADSTGGKEIPPAVFTDSRGRRNLVILPRLRFDPGQPDIVVPSALSPDSGIPGVRSRSAKTNGNARSAVYPVPKGSIIHHAANGITTVFDSTGKQVLRASDARAGSIPVPGGERPATLVHELPSGSVLYRAGNFTYIVFNNEVILVEICESSRGLGILPQARVSEKNPAPQTHGQAAPVSGTEFDPNKVFLERVALSYRSYDWDNSLKSVSARWTVPDAPKTVRPSQVQYLELMRVAYDDVSFYTSANTTGTLSSMINFASVAEWNRISRTWDMSTWIQNTNTSRPAYYATAVPVNTGDTLDAEITSRYVINTTAEWNNTYSWSAGIGNQRGETSNLSLVAQGMESVYDSSFTPVEYRFEISGDNSADSEENFIGDTTFTGFRFTNQRDNSISPGSLSVKYAYVHSALEGKPGFTDMKIENNWPDRLVFHTQAPKVEPQVFTYSVTNNLGAKCATTGKWTYDGNAERDIASMTEYFSEAKNWNNVSWKLAFSNSGPDATKGNFGVNPKEGEHTLNEATLHYHAGHGLVDFNDGVKSGGLVFIDTNYENLTTPLTPTDVEGKWGGKNKWVFLQSCYPLRDKDWQNAFASSNSTHGILGYKTESYAHKDFMRTFFMYAKDYPVRDAFLHTVKFFERDTMIKTPNGNWEHLTAAVVFSNQSLSEKDFLPGYKSGIQPDTEVLKPYWNQWPEQNDGGVE